MKEFSINPEVVMRTANAFETAAENEKLGCAKIREVADSLDPSLAIVAPALIDVSKLVAEHSKKTQLYGSALHNIAKAYRNCDQKVLKNIKQADDMDSSKQNGKDDKDNQNNQGNQNGNGNQTSPAGDVYANTGTAKDPLTQEQINANAEYIYNELRKKGWSKEAICALLGNMTEESGMNPGAWQGQDNLNLGYGLIQFSPSGEAFLAYVSKNYDIKSAADLNKLAKEDPKKLIDIELEFMDQPGSWYYTGGFGKYFDKLYATDYADQLPENPRMSYNDFTHSTDSPAGLALVFEAGFERSGDDAQGRNERAQAAEAWYEYFKDFD